MLDPEQNVVFGGEHIEGYTNENVTIVEILYSDTPFIIPQLFTTFTALEMLMVSFSNLLTVNLPDSTQLRQLYLDRNNIERIENTSFGNQSHLWYLNLRESNIREIEEDAFVGLGALESLVLIENPIESFHPRTFHPLVNVMYLDLEFLLLTSIGDELFSQNTQVQSLYLGYNDIREISPRFSANFERVRYIDLESNECVNRRFELSPDDEFSQIILHNSLRTCYTNFNGTTSDLRRVTLQFEGPLRLFDEFGNMIASV